MIKGMKTIFLVTLIGVAVAALWDKLPVIKESVHLALDPSLGVFLSWHATFGMLIITAIVVLLTTLIQKYTTDQKMLKEIREEQKKIQAEMKQFKEHPEKVMALNKRSMELVMEAMPISMRPFLYTSIPFLLLIRWFGDYFILNPVKILGMSWFWAYLVFTLVLSGIFRKVLKVH